MTDGLHINAINFDVVLEGFRLAPQRSYQFARQEMDRFAMRVRKRVIQGMSGRQSVVTRNTKYGTQVLSKAKSPGDRLYGGQFKEGKHIKAFVTGNDLSSLRAVNKISRILRVHEEGATITAKKAAFLFLSRKTSMPGRGKVFSRVRSVHIPPRLNFEKTWNALLPDGIKKIEAGIGRAVREALTSRMQTIQSGIASLNKI